MTDNSTDSKVQATDKGHVNSGESGTGSGTDVAYGGTAACSAPHSQTDHLMEGLTIATISMKHIGEWCPTKRRQEWTA